MKLFLHAAELHGRGRAGEALCLYEKIGGALPDISQFWHFRGLACLQGGDLRSAGQHLRRALLLTPGDANCLNRLACLFLGSQGAGTGAAAGTAARRYLRACLMLDPLHGEAHYNLGQAWRRGDIPDAREKALASLCKAVMLHPQAAEREHARAATLSDLDRPGAALAALDRAAKLRLPGAEHHFQKGRALFNAFRATDAAASYRRALVLAPGAAETCNNLQITLRALDRHGDSIRAAARARILRPRDPVLASNLAEALFAGGRTEEAFRHYHWRHRKEEVRVERRGLPAPFLPENALPADRPSGTPRAALLLCHEQGIGDEIRFAACLPDIARHFGGPVILESDPRLVPLFRRSFADMDKDTGAGTEIKVIGKLPHLPSPSGPPCVDYAPLVAREHVRAFLMQGDMMHYRHPSPSLTPPPMGPAVSGSPGFLCPDPVERGYWQALFRGPDGSRDTPRVGICWRSGLKRPAWRHNDLEVRHLAPLLTAAECLPVCLQYDECEEELRSLESLTGRDILRPPGIDLRNELDRVAAMIAALDLVVSTNTSVLFLAAAVGTPALGLHAARGALFMGARHNPWARGEYSFVKGGDRAWEPAIREAVPHLISMLEKRQSAAG